MDFPPSTSSGEIPYFLQNLMDYPPGPSDFSRQTPQFLSNPMDFPPGPSDSSRQTPQLLSNPMDYLPGPLDSSRQTLQFLSNPMDYPPGPSDSSRQTLHFLSNPMDYPPGPSDSSRQTPHFLSNPMDYPPGPSDSSRQTPQFLSNPVDFFPYTSCSFVETSPNQEIVAFDMESQIQKLREVLSIKILEEGTEHSTESVTERDSRVLLSEVYVESPALPLTQKRLKATPGENKFFKFAKKILLGNKSALSSKNFSKIHPDIKVFASVFLHFICEENKHCNDPKILMRFLTVIAAMFSNSKLVLNVNQLSSVVKFLIHCLFVDIHHVKHGEFREIVAQMLTMFTNGSSFISRKLYIDIVENFKTKINYLPLDLHHWNAILLTIKFMGVSAIQSVIVQNFSKICKLIDESVKSLESYDCISILKTTEGNVNSVSDDIEIARFNNALKTYMDAANVRALLLKLCIVLIEDVIKEDIRTEKRVIYIPKEIDALLPKDITEPEPIVYKFDHEKFKSFFDNCFEYFGDALNARISPVFIEYERSNYVKATFFWEKYKLYPIENRYFISKKPCQFKKAKQKKLHNSRKHDISNDESSTVLKKFDFSYKTFVVMTPPNPRLGSILTPLGKTNSKKLFKMKGSSKKDETQKQKEKDEAEKYLASIKNVPEPWLRVLRKHYESQNRVEPQHWQFTGNLETYI